MTTPAEEMRAAAKLLREKADDLGEWRYDDRLGYVRDRNGDLVAEVGESDGHWMALMGPGTAVGVAALLEHHAYCVAWADSWDSGLTNGDSIKQFTRSILASATPEES